jgi:hypothetical protein
MHPCSVNRRPLLRQQNSYAILRIPKNRAGGENPQIMKKIILQTLASANENIANSVGRKPCARRGFLLVPLILVCFALCQQVQSASDTPDPGPLPATNTGDGQGALQNVTTGIYNSAFGIFSLLSLTDGNFCTGVGAGTLLLNTASENTATGAGALFSNTIGDQNTANGAFALFNNTEGIRNTAIGDQALFNNIGSSPTDGSSNTAIGAEALSANTTGAFNVAVGNIALGDNADGDGNTAVGVGALFQATGNFNTAVGRLAGQGITTGNNIIAIGLQVDGVSSAFGEVDDSCYIDNIFGADVDLGTVTIVGVDADGKLGTNAVDAAGNRVPVASLVGGQHQAMLSRKVETLQATIAELKSTIAQQKRGMDALTAQLKEQAAQIQKVSAQLEVKKPAPKVVRYEQ